MYLKKYKCFLHNSSIVITNSLLVFNVLINPSTKKSKGKIKYVDNVTDCAEDGTLTIVKKPTKY